MKYSIRIGITVLAAILILYFGTLFLKQSYKKIVGKIYYYKIFFDNVNGLKKEDPVKIFGYEIGKVKSISLVDTGAIVTIEVYQKLPLKKDATAEIQIKELLTGKQIVIYPGNSKEYLNSDFINGIHSHDFSSLTSKMGKIAEEIPEKAVINLFNRIDTLTMVLQKITSILTKEQIKYTWNLLDRNMELLLKIQKDIYKYNTFSTLNKTNTLIDSLHLFLTETKKLITKTNEMLKDYENNKEQIHKTLEYLPITLQQTNKTLKEINKILTSDSSIVKNTIYNKKLQSKLSHLIEKIDTTLEIINSGNLRVGISLKNKKKRK